MESRVSRIARTLDLSPGPNPPTAQLPTYDTLNWLPDMEEGLTEDESDELAARSSAQYLPSILKIISETDVLPNTLERALRLADFIDLKPVSAYDRRFVREHGDEALAYFLALLSFVYHLPGSLFQEAEEKIASYIFLTLSRALREQFDNLLASYPGSSFPVSPISSDQKLALRRLASRLESVSPLDVGKEERNRLWSVLLDWIPQLGAIDLDLTRSKGVVVIPAVWDACEFLRAEWERKGDVGCVDLKDGKELQACSRCLTVRYCSQKHQKLHWKQHKHECFKSSW